MQGRQSLVLSTRDNTTRQHFGPTTLALCREQLMWHFFEELKCPNGYIACVLPEKCSGFIINCLRHGNLYELLRIQTAQLVQFVVIIIIIIFKTMFVVLLSWPSHCESSPGSSDECRTAPSGRRPKTKPYDLGCESACTGCQNLHPPSPFIIITQPESWYSFYRPTEGRRLSRPSWLVNGYIPRWLTRLQTVTHPGTYRVWCSATTLIEANALPLRHTASILVCLVNCMIFSRQLVKCYKSIFQLL